MANWAEMMFCASTTGRRGLVRSFVPEVISYREHGQNDNTINTITWWHLHVGRINTDHLLRGTWSLLQLIHDGNKRHGNLLCYCTGVHVKWCILIKRKKTGQVVCKIRNICFFFPGTVVDIFKGVKIVETFNIIFWLSYVVEN